MMAIKTLPYEKIYVNTNRKPSNDRIHDIPKLELLEPMNL